MLQSYIELRISFSISISSKVLGILIEIALNLIFIIVLQGDIKRGRKGDLPELAHSIVKVQKSHHMLSENQRTGEASYIAPFKFKDLRPKGATM